jgi:hypothetical protein
MTNQDMMPPAIPTPAVGEPVEMSPFLIEFFTVQGTGFRCTAYCDEDCKWHDAFTNEELFGDICILA